MAAGDLEETSPRWLINGLAVEVLTFSEFLEGDERRVTSFVSNFGNWTLPPDVVRAMAAPKGRVEWFHDTGELVLIGDVPEAGVSDTELQPPETAGNSVAAAIGAVVDTVAGPLGAPGLVYRPTIGGVRETVLGSVVSEQARVAVLAVIMHGPLVHKALWGWHLEHHHQDGWSWLMSRLETRESKDA